MLVDQAVAVPEDFDNEANIESKDVAGVNQLWNEGDLGPGLHLAEVTCPESWVDLAALVRRGPPRRLPSSL